MALPTTISGRRSMRFSRGLSRRCFCWTSRNHYGFRAERGRNSLVEFREASSPAVLMLFGREPQADDWRYVGRWAYGAAWLAKDRLMARELVRSRLERTAEAATAAALSAGPGDKERHALVSAIARIPEAIRGEGAFVGAVDRAIDEGAAVLLAEGKDLREITADERISYATRFHLEGFDTAMREVGPDRHILLREVLAQLDEAVSAARGSCLSLRALRLFLQSTLSMDSHEAPAIFEAGSEEYGDPVVRMGIWLLADLALTAQRGPRYENAWAASSRASGDPLSKILAGLSSAARSRGEMTAAIVADPWALVSALALITEPAHASVLLDCAVEAQFERRQFAAREVKRWKARAHRVTELEQRAGLAVLTAHEDREGHRECPQVGTIDLFNAWYWATAASKATQVLAEASDRTVRLEMERRRAKVRMASASVDSARQTQEAAIEAARQRMNERLKQDREKFVQPDGTAAHRGCMYGFSAGCGVMATYAFLGVVVGMEGLMGRIAPLVVAIAALPMGAAILAQLALAMKRAAANAEAQRRRESAEAEFERARLAAERQMGTVFVEARRIQEEAEKELAEFERQVTAPAKSAA